MMKSLRDLAPDTLANILGGVATVLIVAAVTQLRGALGFSTAGTLVAILYILLIAVGAYIWRAKLTAPVGERLTRFGSRIRIAVLIALGILAIPTAWFLQSDIRNTAAAAKNWQSFAHANFAACMPIVLPESIDPAHDLSRAVAYVHEKNNRMTETGIVDTKLILPSDSSNPTDGFDARISNIRNGGDWLRIDNGARISVLGYQNVPETINVLHIYPGCAAGGMNRRFSPVALSPTDIREFTTEYPESDYFSLQPGEFEIFMYTFNCTQPGLYDIKLSIPFTTARNAGLIELDEAPSLICPKSVKFWMYDPMTSALSSHILTIKYPLLTPSKEP